mgnify:CR=1 FL=1
MIRPLILTAGALALALSSSAAELRDLPASTKWVLNLNVKAAQGAPMVTYALDKVAPAKRREAQAKLAAIKALFGVDLLNDITELLIAGDGRAADGGVAYIYATLDTERLKTILAGNSTYTASDHLGFELMSWTDDADKKQKYGAFVRPDLTVMSDNKACVLRALEVLAGKRPALAADSPLKPAVVPAEGDILRLLAVDVPSVVGDQPKAQALRQAQSLSLRVNALQPETLTAALAVTASSNETAVQIRQALMGIQALALLRAAEAPEQATLASLIRIEGEGSTVSVSLNLPKSVIDEAVRQRAERLAAEAAARAAVPAN